ncbi:DUF1570 domain-containing protein [soil metagenome]
MHGWRDRGARWRAGRAWRSSLTATALTALTLVATPSQAAWLRAESARFIVYSDGNEAALRQYVQKLETYDRVLDLYTNLSTETDPPRKLPIYLVPNHDGLDVASPGMGRDIVGVYESTDEDIFAVAQRNAGGDDTILHEYAHHFMLQKFATAYPAWFVEGFAEYFATTEIQPRRVVVGKPSENRVDWLGSARWMPMRTLLSTRYGEVSQRSETYYPLSWLLTSWLLSDAAHKQYLATYLNRIHAGVGSLDAMQQATGLDGDGLEQALRAFMRHGSPYSVVDRAFPDVPITVTPLPASADDLLLLNQQLFDTIKEEDRPVLLARIGALAARHPGDAFAQLVLGHAQVTLGDPTSGEATLTDLLTRDPGNVRALQLLARARMDQADKTDDTDAAAQLRRQARGFLGRAYQADGANFTTLSMLSESRRQSSDFPNDNDVETMRLAYQLAPQLPAARMNLAQVLIYRGNKAEGITLLRPLANSPHDPQIAASAQRMIDEANGVTSDPADAPSEDAGDGDETPAVS